eukprot:CAMPEP_0206205938 /NCGR_PEP_ID=MMETSP0166-20121206/14557_1 /ASSEMBLY_ACC=CAM_ASM_000260 /TAXON_ID=95228 /ORGANISM="Vannella robusta, Strain DIVA3 518/3/11/1/6" /LENGTH=177 /DNA_ID=CAMNT_0053626131 /DNA_START=49 /DNA_END=582 /DNA_ORIENTATION=+
MSQKLWIKEDALPTNVGEEIGDAKEADPMLSSLLSGEDMEEEDPYYDHQRDEKDEKWAHKNISGAQERSGTDAVLNCPSCFTLLCVDCQRHEIFSDQYRAMFVTNCKVNCYAQVTFKAKKKAKRNQKTKWERVEVDDSSAHAPDELYFPVTCAYCETEVAVYDCNEIYHFFNTVSGY